MLSRLPTRCPSCREKFTAEERGLRLHPACVDAWVEAVKAKQRAKQAREVKVKAKLERAVTRQRRTALETIPELIRAADKDFAAYIRLRDRVSGFDCISSGKPLDWNAGNQVDAGHYRSRGAASHLRYNEDNCHAQSKYENRHRAGNAVEYRIRLIRRIGPERVEALEADNEPHHWTREELRAIRAEFKEKRRALERATTETI